MADRMRTGETHVTQNAVHRLASLSLIYYLIECFEGSSHAAAPLIGMDDVKVQSESCAACMWQQQKLNAEAIISPFCRLKIFSKFFCSSTHHGALLARLVRIVREEIYFPKTFNLENVPETITPASCSFFLF